jgi:hypothetical protein
VLTWCQELGVDPDDERLNPTAARSRAAIRSRRQASGSSRSSRTACASATCSTGSPRSASGWGWARRSVGAGVSATEFKLQRVGDLALVTIDNGEDWTKPSTFGRAALESLERTLDELESQEWAGLVLTGKPYVFAVGADIDQFPNVTPDLARAGSRAGHELFLRIRELPFPTLAAINGAALGGGLEIALHCDHRTIARSVRHVGTPEVFLGLFPAWGGTQLLPAAGRRRKRGEGRREQPAAPEPDADAQKSFELGSWTRCSTTWSSSTTRSRTCRPRRPRARSRTSPTPAEVVRRARGD